MALFKHVPSIVDLPTGETGKMTENRRLCWGRMSGSMSDR